MILSLFGLSRALQGSKRRRGVTQSGSSLLEIVISTLIIGLLAIGIVEFFAKGRVWFDQEERKRVATLLAQESLERTISRPYASISNWTETRRIGATPYSIAVSVQNDAPEMHLTTVRSSVSWQANPTAQRSVSLATLVYDN